MIKNRLTFNFLPLGFELLVVVGLSGSYLSVVAWRRGFIAAHGSSVGIGIEVSLPLSCGSSSGTLEIGSLIGAEAKSTGKESPR